MKELLYGMTKQEYIDSINELLFECENLELLYFMGRNNLIKKNNVKPMIALASEQGKTAVTAFLLDYNNRIMK